jgi:putative transposase
MKRVQAYKYELMPNGEQKRNMRRFAGSCRYLYNKALAVKKEVYEKEGKSIGYYGPEGTAKRPVIGSIR